MHVPSPGRTRLSLFAVAAALLAGLVGALASHPARADSPLEGKWTQGPLKEEYNVVTWQKECEARPVGGSSGGGEQVSIHAEGDELSFVGGGRVYKTNQCYDQMPTLSRETHTRSPSGREWRTRCTTPPNDPRHGVMNTLVVATSDTHIDIIETGRYESTLAGGLCTADVKRSRSFDLVARDNPLPAPVPTAPPQPAVVAPPPDPRPKPPIPVDAPRRGSPPASKRARPGSCCARGRASSSALRSSTRPAARRTRGPPGRSTTRPGRRSPSTPPARSRSQATLPKGRSTSS